MIADTTDKKKFLKSKLLLDCHRTSKNFKIVNLRAEKTTAC